VLHDIEFADHERVDDPAVDVRLDGSNPSPIGADQPSSFAIFLPDPSGDMADLSRLEAARVPVTEVRIRRFLHLLLSMGRLRLQ
jgi:hypothetical protein